ncbi:cytochrome P450 [Allostreptomyces psammosilenae]|uniref:Cytochrome P450 n=1 Tax=Allostreptomyces psammosilenae TaxID=1892865 RepID=A0A852ZY20_9ACTN|nr:cytochrome P450 [Allostreptomyces psammosilenae]NYI07226.1 cytochrome P450 [Allostreptomyces psammosilenae]
MTPTPDLDAQGAQAAPGATPPPGCPAHAGGGTTADGGAGAGASTGAGGSRRRGVPLYGPDFAENPSRIYAHLREYGPIAPVELAPGVDAMLVTGYQAALGVLRSPERFGKDARRWRALRDGEIPPDSPVIPMMMPRPNALFSDGDVHARLRGAVTDSLDRVDPHALRGYVERSADVLLDRIAPRGEVDLLADYCKVLPRLVFNELFGSPESFGDRLVDAMAGIFDGVDAEKANAVLAETLAELVATKRRSPGADVTSWLVTHPARLTDEEMIHQLVTLLGAGVEPMTNLISNAVRLLLSDDRFAGDLRGGSLPVEDALDEVLWTDPPMANYGVHYPLRDVDHFGIRLREGEPVVVSFAAANTDPALAPSGQRPGNRAHLAWSAGPHTCPAQSPARLIASVAIEKLLDRIPDLDLAVPAHELRWRPGPFHRALAALPARFAPVQLDETPGEQPWNVSPAPSSSTPPVETSTAKAPASEPPAPRRRWSSPAAWWRGR